ncbi:MAG: hypothetical protein PHI63_02220 [Patescibacteria group bacterium]|nr:hypothetical protein [Patescibacteria group bacterium]
MTLSNYLAELWGITIVVVALTLLIKPKLLKKLFAEVENEATMFFWGVVTFIIGVAMVLAHNVWVPDWRVAITILGWLSMFEGLDVLFLPERMKKRWSKMENWQWVTIFMFLLIVGLILTYLGFTA